MAALLRDGLSTGGPVVMGGLLAAQALPELVPRPPLAKRSLGPVEVRRRVLWKRRVER